MSTEALIPIAMIVGFIAGFYTLSKVNPPGQWLDGFDAGFKTAIEMEKKIRELTKKEG